MRAPSPDIFIHTRDQIAFGPLGLLELTLAQVEALQAFHMRGMTAAALAGDLDQHDQHQAASTAPRGDRAEIEEIRRQVREYLASGQKAPKGCFGEAYQHFRELARREEAQAQVRKVA